MRDPNTKAKLTKATVVQLRFRSEEKAFLTRAARIRRTTVSNFLLEHGLKAAQQILADQVDFTLSAKGWKAFCEALAASPRRIPGLDDLFKA